MKKNVLIVQSTYYKEISKSLLLGATNYIKNVNFNNLEINFKIKNVPGSFEIPFQINKNKDQYDAFIALGCIIRGETYHFELISNEVTRKIMDLSISINKPIGFGILTCENIDQAKIRSDIDKKNKGLEAAKACLDMLV